jgi:hypothetical protein
VEYEPPPAFAPPSARTGPLTPQQVHALLTPTAGSAGAEPDRALPLARTPWALIVGAAVVTAAVLVWALVLLADAGSDRAQRTRVSLPAVSGRYQLVQAVDGATVAAMVQRQLGSLGPVQGAVDAAQVGIYRLGTDGPTTLVFLGFNAADSAQIDRLLGSGSYAQVAAQVLSGVGGGSPAGMQAGPFGGALQCAQAVKNAQPLTPCAWADRSTLGLVLQIGTVDLANAGATARSFRSAAEH